MQYKVDRKLIDNTYDALAIQLKEKPQVINRNALDWMKKEQEVARKENIDYLEKLQKGEVEPKYKKLKEYSWVVTYAGKDYPEKTRPIKVRATSKSESLQIMLSDSQLGLFTLDIVGIDIMEVKDADI